MSDPSKSPERPDGKTLGFLVSWFLRNGGIVLENTRRAVLCSGIHPPTYMKYRYRYIHTHIYRSIYLDADIQIYTHTHTYVYMHVYINTYIKCTYIHELYIMYICIIHVLSSYL